MNHPNVSTEGKLTLGRMTTGAPFGVGAAKNALSRLSDMKQMRGERLLWMWPIQRRSKDRFREIELHCGDEDAAEQ